MGLRSEKIRFKDVLIEVKVEDEQITERWRCCLMIQVFIGSKKVALGMIFAFGKK
jgi:hypothetical protein